MVINEIFSELGKNGIETCLIRPEKITLNKK